MTLLFDLFYMVLSVLLSPWLLLRAWRTGRNRHVLATKLLGPEQLPRVPQPTVWFHGVSVGEIHLLAIVIPAFQKRHPSWRVVVSSTTTSGLAEARAKFPVPDVVVYPFDFSWACHAAFDAVRPNLVVLAESELWPNFLAIARQRGIPVAVINGRISQRSFARMWRVRSIVHRFLLKPVTGFAVQSETYAQQLRVLGVRSSAIHVTGAVKYDGATDNRLSAAANALRAILPFASDHLVWVAGSTHAPEEEMVLRVFGKLKSRFPNLHLILVPRHPARFTEVADLIQRSGHAFVRRSQLTTAWATLPAVVLLDTIGELGAAWSLAAVGFSGGSFDGVRQGQSMIEPAGFGVPNCFGPHISNFRDAVQHLLEADAAAMVQNEAELERTLTMWLSDAALRESIGNAAQALVKAQQGATQRTLDVLDELMEREPEMTRSSGRIRRSLH